MCIDHLDEQCSMDRIGLIGWSFGWAVVISVAAKDLRVRTVAAVASRSCGTQDVGRISASILLVHGTADQVLPYLCSNDIYERAHQPKKLVLFPGADHGISQHRDEMLSLIKGWFPEYLPAP